MKLLGLFSGERRSPPSLWSSDTCRKLSPRTLEPLVTSQCMAPQEHQHEGVAAILPSWSLVLQGDNPKSPCMPSPAEPGVQHGKSEHHLLHANLTGLSRAAHRLCRAPPARWGVERKYGDGARLSLSSSQILLSSLTSWWPKTSTSRAERLLGSTVCKSHNGYKCIFLSCCPLPEWNLHLGFLQGYRRVSRN